MNEKSITPTQFMAWLDGVVAACEHPVVNVIRDQARLVGWPPAVPTKHGRGATTGVLRALATLGPSTTREIRKHVEDSDSAISPASIYSTLLRLRRDGRVVRRQGVHGNFVYRLRDQAEHDS